MIPFSLLWGGFALFWESSVIREGAPGFFALWGIPFVLAGIYVTVGRFFVDARIRRNTSYAVTGDRVIIRSGLLAPSTKSLNIRTLSDLTLSERKDGSGTITFGSVNPLLTMYAGFAWPGVAQTPSFELIPDARTVYGIIRDAQRAVPSGAA